MAERDVMLARHAISPSRLGAYGTEAAGLLLVFLMLFVPAAYQPLKAALLALILAALASWALFERRIGLHPDVAFGCLLFSVIGIGFILRGYVAGAPGALKESTVYVMWPLVNGLLMTGLTRPARLWRLARLFVWTTIAICLYCASYILWSAGWLPGALYLPLNQGQEIGFYKGYIEFGVYSMASLLFLVPFVAAALLAWGHASPVRRVWLWLALLFGLAIGVLSGRRAFQLVLMLSLPIALAFRLMLPRRLRGQGRAHIGRSLFGAVIVAVVALAVLQVTYDLRLGVVWDKFKTGFQFAVDPVAQSRAIQFDALIGGWSASPLLGSGHGASAPGVIRDPAMPWAYELAYVALLFHTGIVGFLLYACGVGWIFLQGIAVIRRGTSLSPLMASVLTGTTAFLVANATNPYLEKFDCLWTLFLPLAVINASLLGHDRAGRVV